MKKTRSEPLVRGGPFFAPEKCLKEFILRYSLVAPASLAQSSFVLFGSQIYEEK